MIEKIILADPRSFCPGVKRIVNIVELVAKKYSGKPIFLNHEAVHNKHVTDKFNKMEILIEEDPEKLPQNAVYILSAHGSSPSFKERVQARKDVTMIDAACPLVSKVHLEVNRYAALDYTIIYVGHKGHAEAEAVMSIRPDRTVFVNAKGTDDAKSIQIPNPNSDKLICLTQTTLSVDESKEIMDILKKRFPSLTFPPAGDICLATTNRQAAVKALAKQSDMVLVIGSKNSSNSKRLAETAAMQGVAAYLVDDVTEINKEWLKDKNAVGITAGASAPEHLVQEVVEFFKNNFNGQLKVETLKVTEENANFALPKELM